MRRMEQPLFFWSLVVSLGCPALGQGWVSPDCLEKLREGEECGPTVDSPSPSPSTNLRTLEDENCPAGRQCVDLFQCQSVCQAVAEGNLSRDRDLQVLLKEIHCGLGDQETPLVCCERKDIAGEGHCRQRDIRQKMKDFQRRQKDPEKERDRESGTCGLRKVFSFNIAGGENTNPGDWPWMARLIYTQGNLPSQLCGGTLISRRHVVTAAHCVNETSPVLVRLGDSDLRTEFDCLDVEEGCNTEGPACLENLQCAPRYMDYQLENVIIHQDFSFRRLGVPKYDVALISLARPVEWTDYIQPVCLPRPQGEDRGPLLITGWGDTRLGVGPPSPAPILQLLHVTEVPLAFCNDQWRALVDEDLLPSHICVTAGLDNVGQSSCKGDSGGPLVRNFESTSEEVWQLAGVVSFGTANCGNVDLPLGFIRIDGEVNTWLRNIVGQILPEYPSI